MPQQIFGAEAAVSMVNRALANTSPAHTVYLNQVAAAGTTDASQYAFAAQLGAQYAVGKTAADLSALLLGNMGVSNAILQAAVTECCERGWGGFKAEWLANSKARAGPSAAPAKINGSTRQSRIDSYWNQRYGNEQHQGSEERDITGESERVA